MAQKRLAFFECDTTSDDFGRWVVTEQRLITKDEVLPKPSGAFLTWLDWAEPGEVYRMRNGTIYTCVQLTTEE